MMCQGNRRHHPPYSYLSLTNIHSISANLRQGHTLPGTSECFNVIAEFFRIQGLALMQSYSQEILTMQKRLKGLELQATNMIAHESGLNPPRALMAVIDRNLVGGWSGGRRNEPGGGAPCPSEFVLKEQQRKSQTKRAGPDRRKPESKEAGAGVTPVK